MIDGRCCANDNADRMVAGNECFRLTRNNRGQVVKLETRRIDEDGGGWQLACR